MLPGKTFVHSKLSNFKSGLSLNRTVNIFNQSGCTQCDKTGKTLFTVQLRDENMDFTDKRIKMAFGISARALQRFPATGVSLEQLEAMDAELKEANL